MITPTVEQTTAYQSMFDYFNRELFGGQLAPVVLNFSRKARSLGFFAPERWDDGQGTTTHEISLNPEHLKRRTPIDTASTLVHEMVHLWQEEHGKPGRRGYHNREWGDKMESIGLMPSNTGAPGGSRTGTQMTHYIVEGGRFAQAFATMSPSYLLPWACVSEGSKGSVAKNKVKYTCAGCSTKVWGKPELAIVCRECDQDFVVAA